MEEENLVADITETPNEETQEENSQEIVDTPDPKEKRHAQQLEWSRQEVERWRWLAIDTAFDLAVKDINSLQELHNKDPKLAKSVADKFDREWSDWWSYQGFISWKRWTEVKQSSKISEDELEAMLLEREAKKEHQKATDRLEKGIGKLPEDIQDDVQAYIDKYSKGLQLTTDTADELLEMATLYVNRGVLKWEAREEAKVKLSSTWTTTKKPWKEEMVTVIRNWKLVLVPNTFDNV